MKTKIKRLLASVLAMTLLVTNVGFTSISQTNENGVTEIVTEESQNDNVDVADTTIPMEEIKPPIKEDVEVPPEENDKTNTEEKGEDKPTTLPSTDEDETDDIQSIIKNLDLSNAKLFDADRMEYVDVSNLSLLNEENTIMPMLEPNYTHFVYNGGALRLDVGKPLFGYHQTNEFYIYQGSEKTVGYCFQSNKSNPSDGNYTAVDLTKIPAVWIRVIGRIMQYAPGTIGYNNYKSQIQSWFSGKLPYDYPIYGNSKDDTDYILSHISNSIGYASGDTGVVSEWGQPWVSVANEWAYFLDSPAGRQQFPDECPYPGYRYRLMILQTGNAVTQDIGFLTIQPNDGYLKLKKSSSDPSLTDGNDCYSLAGAEYGVYSNAQCTSKVATLITDANGDSNTVKLATGTYYVREDKAPKGFALDRTVRPVTITNGHTSNAPALVQVQDIPLMDPVNLMMKKVDSKTGLSKASSPTATLEGAEFEYKFYKGNYDVDPATLGKTPVKKWVFRTDEKGRILFSDKYKVSGDDFWYDAVGKPSMPIGTLTMQEIKSPEGFLINDKVFVVKITEQGGEAVFPEVTPEIPEQIFTLHLVKKQADKEVVIPGVVFEHTRPGGTVDEYTTDEKGEIAIEGLQYGEHIVKEKATSDGYIVNEGEVKFRINEDNSMEILSNTSTDENGKIELTTNYDGNLSMVVEDKVIPPALKIIKENNKGLLLEGAEFTLYSDENCTQVVDKAVSDSKGEIQFKNINIDTDYYLKETGSPQGYKLPIDENGNEIIYKIRFESVPAQGIFNFIVDGKVYSTDTNDDMFFVENNTGVMKVINTQQLQLPATGSNTNLILIIVGTVLTLGALIMFSLIKSKRSKANEK